MEVPIPKKCLQVLFTWEKDNNKAEVSLGVATEGGSLIISMQSWCYTDRCIVLRCFFGDGCFLELGTSRDRTLQCYLYQVAHQSLLGLSLPLQFVFTSSGWLYFILERK